MPLSKIGPCLRIGFAIPHFGISKPHNLDLVTIFDINLERLALPAGADRFIQRHFLALVFCHQFIH